MGRKNESNDLTTCSNCHGEGKVRTSNLSEEALRRQRIRQRNWDFWKVHAPLLAFGIASLRLFPWILFKVVLVPCLEMVTPVGPIDFQFVGAVSIFWG